MVEDEEGRNNHARVERVHEGLKRRGLNMWFDSERMQDSILDQMIQGIDESDLVIVFITKKYCASKTTLESSVKNTRARSLVFNVENGRWREHH